MIASKKIKRSKPRESEARKPKAKPHIRIIDVKLYGSGASSYVSLPKEPWAQEATK